MAGMNGLYKQCNRKLTTFGLAEALKLNRQRILKIFCNFHFSTLSGNFDQDLAPVIVYVLVPESTKCTLGESSHSVSGWTNWWWWQWGWSYFCLEAMGTHPTTSQRHTNSTSQPSREVLCEAILDGEYCNYPYMPFTTVTECSSTLWYTGTKKKTFYKKMGIAHYSI